MSGHKYILCSHFSVSISQTMGGALCISSLEEEGRGANCRISRGLIARKT